MKKKLAKTNLHLIWKNSHMYFISQVHRLCLQLRNEKQTKVLKKEWEVAYATL